MDPQGLERRLVAVLGAVDDGAAVGEAALAPELVEGPAGGQDLEGAGLRRARERRGGAVAQVGARR